MTADGFLAQKQRHPLAMTAAIAINVAAVTAVMLAKSGWVPPIETILIGENIPLPHPDPVKPDDPPKAPVQKNPVYIPPRPVPTDLSKGPDIAGTDVLPPVTGLTGGSGTEPVVEPTPTATPSTTPITVGAEQDSRYAGDFQPPYPPQLLRTGVEGKAVVKVLIGTDGRVKQVVIVSADDPLFADASERQALRRWRFRPATRDGVPIESWKQMTVRFEIRA